MRLQRGDLRYERLESDDEAELGDFINDDELKFLNGKKDGKEDDLNYELRGKRRKGCELRGSSWGDEEFENARAGGCKR
jgi:hypothetical protein